MDSMARNYLRGYRSCFVFLWLLPRFSFLVIIFIYFDMASTVRTTCIVTIIFLFFFSYTYLYLLLQYLVYLSAYSYYYYYYFYIRSFISGSLLTL